MTRIFSRWVRTLVWNWTGTKFLRCHAFQEETAEGNFVRASRDEISTGTPGTNSKRAYVQQEMNQISEKEHLGSFHNSLVHMLITIQEALRIPETKAVVNNESRKLKWRPSSDEKKIKSTPAVIQRAKKDCKTDHFANLLDLCPLNNAELTNRVLQRRDIVKDEEYCRAVFAQQGQQQNFWTQFQNFLIELERHVTLFQRTPRIKWQKFHDEWNHQKKNVQRYGYGFFHDKDQNIGIRWWKTPWFLFKGIYTVIHELAFFGKEKSRKC